jgi:hypothetical protein
MTERILPEDSLQIITERMERHRISHLSRRVRRPALIDIFDGLGVTTLQQRLKVLRNVVYEISRYNHEGRDFFAQKPREQQDWCSKIGHMADALAERIAEHPKAFELFFLQSGDHSLEQVVQITEMLRHWRTRAGELTDEGSRTCKSGPRHKMRRLVLLCRLGHIYQAATGKPVKRMNRRRPNEQDDSFVQFMRGVWSLAGEPKSDNAIDDQIRDWQNKFRN